MTARIPSPRTTPWYLSETVRAVGDLIAACIGGLIVFLKTWREVTTSTSAHGQADVVFWLALAAMVWLVISGALRLAAAWRRDRDASDHGDPTHLLAPLRVLYALVAKQKGLGPDEASKNKFRVTLHRQDAVSETHEQCVPYVGGRTVDAKAARAMVGRRWSNSLGLVGQAIRSRTQLKRLAVSENVCDVDS